MHPGHADDLRPAVVQIHVAEAIIIEARTEFFLERCIVFHHVVPAAVDEEPSVDAVCAGGDQDAESVVRKEDIVSHGDGRIRVVEFVPFHRDGFQGFAGIGVQGLQHAVRTVDDIQPVVIRVELEFSRLPVQVERLQDGEGACVQFIDPARELGRDPEPGFILRQIPALIDSLDRHLAVMERDDRLPVEDDPVVIGRFHLETVDAIVLSQVDEVGGHHHVDCMVVEGLYPQFGIAWRPGLERNDLSGESQAGDGRDALRPGLVEDEPFLPGDPDGEMTADRHRDRLRRGEDREFSQREVLVFLFLREIPGHFDGPVPAAFPGRKGQRAGRGFDPPGGVRPDLNGPFRVHLLRVNPVAFDGQVRWLLGQGHLLGLAGRGQADRLGHGKIILGGNLQDDSPDHQVGKGALSRCIRTLPEEADLHPGILDRTGRFIRDKYRQLAAVRCGIRLLLLAGRKKHGRQSQDDNKGNML